jgi:hypothetical protein
MSNNDFAEYLNEVYAGHDPEDSPLSYLTSPNRSNPMDESEFERACYENQLGYALLWFDPIAFNVAKSEHHVVS